MRGVTLVELIVTLAVLGIVLGLATVGLASLRPSAAVEGIAALNRARADAIRSGRAVQVDGDSQLVMLLLPDGRVLGPGVDLFTGAPRDSI